jgi:hypothetical protein
MFFRFDFGKSLIQFFGYYICWLLIILNISIAVIYPAEAIESEAKTLLSIENLKSNLNNLTIQEGLSTIELNNLIINLNDSNSDFRSEFYRQINDKIARSEQPLSLDLSNSLIRGNLQLNRLGITTPLVAGALSSLLTPAEREKIAECHNLITKPGIQIPLINIFRGSLKLDRAMVTDSIDLSHSLFLQSVSIVEARFQQEANFSNIFFDRDLDFSGSIFEKKANFERAHFLNYAKFKQVRFLDISNFNNSYFKEKANFEGTVFSQLADFSRSKWLKIADFSKTIWRDRVIFSKSRFVEALKFTAATFEQTVSFRDVYVKSAIDLRDVSLLNRIDFSNALFASNTAINVSGLAFDNEAAKIIGDTGRIGKVIYIPTLENNETLVRNLIINFRNLEQIFDANQIEYQRTKLKLEQLNGKIIATFWQDLLSLNWFGKLWQWLSLSLLLLLGDYGTNFSVVFSAGIIAIAFFSLIFWLVDRYRPQIAHPIIPKRAETIYMSVSFSVLTIIGIVNIFLNTNKPGLTLICLTIILVPIPTTLSIVLYWRGRYHKLLNSSYFVEDGSLRQFRLLLGRLPIMPRFPFFRDRYQQILWDKHWNWLNYYDFSLNNILKFGFNDLRVRDEHLPGIISFLVWYQWCLGVVYIILLLWTISRTIPGLNLLLYF